MKYDQLSHAQLYAMRAQMPPTDPRHAEIAPYEHAAFAREWTQEQPLRAIPSLMFAIPAYTGAKALGLTKARSPASLRELLLGYRGMGQGIAGLLSR